MTTTAKNTIQRVEHPNVCVWYPQAEVVTAAAAEVEIADEERRVEKCKTEQQERACTKILGRRKSSRVTRGGRRLTNE